jgi:hypothetical protein
MIEFEQYFDIVRKGFEGVKNLGVRETENSTLIREDVFKIYWMARVRFCSFVAVADDLDVELAQQFVLLNLKIARNERSKIGELLAVISVIACEHVTDEVREMAESRPPKHTTMSEYLVVADLSEHKAYYYRGPILYGILYEKFEREYIDGHFALPLRILSEKQK